MMMWSINVLGCRVDILGTDCDQCVCMVQCCFTSTETIRLIRTGRPGTATSTFTQLLNSDAYQPTALPLGQTGSGDWECQGWTFKVAPAYSFLYLLFFSRRLVCPLFSACHSVTASKSVRAIWIAPFYFHSTLD